ncbi:Lrp/AsnC family transcriptional regulator [Candidatus Bathyarchaeota archaeon]|nr:Lrp/AsnC family transcriptional regulator [Candidatus Bathyarchaeota archaeon]
MEKALVLTILDATFENEALEELRKLDEVREAHFLYGPYDTYVMIEADSSQQLQDIVFNKIRRINGITSTITCFIAD